MYRQIENLEKKTAQLQTELDALKERLCEAEKQTKYDIDRHWNAICDLRYAKQETREEIKERLRLASFSPMAPHGGFHLIEDVPEDNRGSQPAAVAAPVGFPWALVIQILMAILTYLIQRAVTKSERDVLAELKSKLARETGGTAE